ncbi:hypothetical protein ACSBR2_004782 [Camellia fascicularis]
MDSQPEINSKMRSILIDWLTEVHRKFELMLETLYLTVNIVDRYLLVNVVPRRELQLVGISSMLIACKYKEIWAPGVLLGCAFDESIVHHKYIEYNLDSKNSTYSTKNGIYSEGCGLDNVMILWGHDNYMYLVAKENGTTLPPAALFIIRYHSFYPLHKSGAYTHLMNADDVENLKWLKIFNKYDLYSKSKVRIDVEKVKPYYLSLIEKVSTTLVRKLVFPSQVEMVNIPN